MEKMKKMANCLSLNRAKALRPRLSARLELSFFLVGQAGMDRAYPQSTMLISPEEINCVNESCMATPSILRKLVASMLIMKPTVPNTLIGGNALTGSIPAFSRAL